MSLLGKIERQLNHVLALDEETLRSLQELSGEVISLELINTGCRIYLLPSGQGMQLRTEIEGDENVKIRGMPADMMFYLLKSKDRTGGFAGSIEVTGDVGLAQDFQSIMKKIDLDWEEQLAQWFGDTAAHKMGRLLRGAADFAGNTGYKLQQDVSEYLRFESGMTPDGSEMDEFIQAVDTLRNDVERLKLRINRLEQNKPVQAE